MSMIGEYARLTAEEFARALEDPQWAQERVGELVEAELGGGPGGAEARCLDTDKAWHALDFLLSRIGFPVDVVFGEGAIPGAEDWGYTPPRYLTPARVRVAAEALRDTPVERLVEGVGPEDLARAEVYPVIVWERGEPLEYVTAYYEALVPFFGAAARDGDAVLMWLD
ncbi:MULTISPECIES: YfbM family protein [Streptomyces]|uniref:YfbM family protein n=1 Tax=Streptomyces sudanensis TaxID=436397 RepID=A0ABY4T9U5_9ACTN|nr:MULTISPECIES: YfbM family protein [Streptomyces]MCP9986472.1 YfbM family protein [Streptomyces sudanensis]MCQ0002115.1 YfbM family protein [Streptomyces sudanensis]URN15020.1 YfbM family protein [Streptomyces sudanensis]